MRATRKHPVVIHIEGQEPVRVAKLPEFEFLDRPAMQEFVEGKDNVTGFFSTTMAVRDVWRLPSGFTPVYEEVVLTHSSRFADVFTESIAACSPEFFDEYPPVVMLLESPHTEEYCLCPCSGKYRPLAPAQGTTGRNIQRFIDANADIFEAHPLILCNPIPWQTSLEWLHGIPLREKKSDGKQDTTGKQIRDAVWKAVWKQHETVASNLYGKMNDTYKPRAIINACTGGIDSNGLRCILQRSLRDNLRSHETLVIESSHPSSRTFNAKSNQNHIVKELRSNIDNKSLGARKSNYEETGEPQEAIT
jgi:hypothetical protein